jgi:phosphodiesterase/alkaline phosphatase D-like protein
MIFIPATRPTILLSESGRIYYCVGVGDALFVVLDPYWYTKPKPDSLTGWRWTLGKEQYDWLKSTLEQSTSTFKFVFMHQLVGGDKDGRGGTEYADKYEWGGNNLDAVQTDGQQTGPDGTKPLEGF